MSHSQVGQPHEHNQEEIFERGGFSSWLNFEVGIG